MSETIAEYIVNLLGDKISPEFIAFFVSLLPVLELRGGLIAAKLMEIDFFKAFAICYIGTFEQWFNAPFAMTGERVLA